MLTGIVIITPQNVPGSDVPRALVRSLSALVSAAVEGVLRDVIVASALPPSLPEAEEMSRVADHAGCDFVAADQPAAALLLALGKARGASLFVLRPGRAPEQGYVDELAEIASASKPAALLRERSSGFVTRLFPAVCPVAGVVGLRADLQRAFESGAAEPAALARYLRAPLTMRHRARVLD